MNLQNALLSILCIFWCIHKSSIVLDLILLLLLTCPHVFLVLDLIVVVASIIVLAVGSNGQVFATSAVR